MTPDDLAVIVRSVGPVIREYVTATVQGLTARLAELEARPVPRDGRDGERGQQGDKGIEGQPGARGERGERGEPGERGGVGPQGPQGDRGDRGTDGSSVDEALIEAMVARHVMATVGALPVPTNGKDGRDVSVEEVRSLVDAEVERRMASIPTPKDVANAVIDRDGQLVLTFSDGTVKTLGVVVGRDGRPGEPGAKGADGINGRDGFGFEDMAAESDGERTITLSFQKGDDTKRFQLRMGNPVYRGVFKAGTSYERGDQVTWGGSTWTALSDTSAKPGESASESRAWVLTTQRGRDGKAGPEGKVGPRGPQGEQGIQGRSGY
jgi:hypothetical protein